MLRQIKAQRIRAALVFFIFVLSFISFIDLPPSYEEQSAMINTMPSLVVMDVNLKALLMYNKADNSFVSDVKTFFIRDIPSTSKVYSMHKMNISSSLLLVLLPLLMVMTLLVILHVSIDSVLLILTIFLCFTVLPMFVM